MREFNALQGYPQPKQRIVGPGMRTIKNKIVASYRDQRYYDGERNDGYGGYKYDGRWRDFVGVLEVEYGLQENSSILQLGCEKGFLLHDIIEKFPKANVMGFEMSDYAIAHAMPSIKSEITKGSFSQLPYEDGQFDIVLAIGVVYSLTLADCIKSLKEIERVGKGKSFITLGAYFDDSSRRLFKDYWSLLGSTVLHVDEWPEVLSEAGYTGDYTFLTAKSLNLVEA